MRGDGGLSTAPNRKGGDAAAPRTIIFHGTADSTVHPSNAERLAAAANSKAHTSRTESGTARNGRPYNRTLIGDRDGGAAVDAIWRLLGGYGSDVRSATALEHVIRMRDAVRAAASRLP